MLKFLLFAFLCLCLLNFASSITLTIKEAGTNSKYYIELDRLLTLTCESDSLSQKEKVEWYIPTNPVVPVTSTDTTQRVSIRSESSGNKLLWILNIRDVDKQYSGMYYCRVYNYDGNIQRLLAEASVIVTLYRSITILNCRNEQWIQNGSTGNLRCEMSSEPTAIVTWSLNGKDLMQSDKYKIMPGGIDIYGVTQADAGHYVVSARQIDYTSSLVRDIMVTVFELPRIISGPTILSPITDGVVEFWYSDIECKATGNPMPTIHWFRTKNGNQELQLADPQKFFVNTNPKVGRLRISRPVYPDDNDVYTCQAMLINDAISNDAFPKDVVSKSITLSVSVRPEYTDIDQMNILIEPGKTARIRCRVKTTDPVILTWQKYNSYAYGEGVQKFDPRITVTHNKEKFNELFQVLTLEIKNVQFSDSWNYSCIVTCPGANFSLNGTISVRQKPLMWNTTSLHEFGWLFNATNLTCIATGLPHPKWNWFRNTFYPVQSDGNTTFKIISYDYEIYSISWLQINPDLSTQYFVFDIYQCQAINDEGEGRNTIRFSQANVPNPPKPTIVKKTASKFVFRLTPPTEDGHMKLMHYELVYRAMQGPTIIYGPVIYQPDELDIVMDGLVHDIGYQISFYACNAVGRSQDSTLIVQTLAPSVPNPIKVTSRKRSNYPYTYNLLWIVPSNGGFPITSYRFRIRAMKKAPIFRGNATQWFLVNNPEYLSAAEPAKIFEPLLVNPYINYYRFDDLEAETIYEVQINVRNQLGSSNTTTFYFYTPHRDLLGKPPRVRGFQCPTAQPFCSIILFFSVFLLNLFIY